MERAERSQRTGITRRLKAVGEKLVRQEVVCALFCEQEDNRVVKGSKIAERGREKKVQKRRHRVVVYRQCQRVCVW